MNSKESASILLIYTGGTIGMTENRETGVLETFNFQHLVDNVPELKQLGHKVDSYQFDPPLDSSAMGPDSWMKIVRIIADNVLYGISLEFYAGEPVQTGDSDRITIAYRYAAD